MVSNAALLRHLGFALALALLSSLVVWGMLRARIMDRPNHRSAHTRPTPKGGGVGVVVAFLLGSVVLQASATYARLAEPYAYGFLAGAVTIALVSLADDIRDFRFTVKLGAQALAALVVIAAGLRIETLSVPLLGQFELGLLAWPVTLLWIVGLTNAMNFVDGLDGLVAGTALIACVFLAVAAEAAGGAFVYFGALLLAAGVLGFLPWNLNPARIFLGDVGSQFIGYVLAVLGVAAARFDSGQVSFWIVPILLLAPIFDTVFTLLRRARARENLASAHRGHLYQVLARTGWSVRSVALLHWSFALLHGAAALWFLQLAPSGKAALIAGLLGLQFGLLALVRQRAARARLERW